MKKLGKKINVEGNTIEAYACACGGCVGCACTTRKLSATMFTKAKNSIAYSRGYRK